MNFIFSRDNALPDPQCESLHRLLFFIYYLNDVDAGGETEFLFQKTKVQPRKVRQPVRLNPESQDADI